MSEATEQKLKKALVAGLAAWTGLPSTKVIPAFGREVPQKPYIQYEFFQAWQYPGSNVENNPPSRAFQTLVPQEPPVLTSMVVGGGGVILIDTAQNFQALEVQPFYEVRIGNKSSYVMRVRTVNTLELRHPIVVPGQTYTLRRQIVRVEYWKSSLKGLAVQCVAATPVEADGLSEKIANFFKLPSGFRDSAIAVQAYWGVRSVGGITNVDEVSNNQIVARKRDITVTLIGHEIISEERPPIELLDWSVQAPESGIRPAIRPPEWPHYEVELPINVPIAT